MTCSIPLYVRAAIGSVTAHVCIYTKGAHYAVLSHVQSYSNHLQDDLVMTVTNSVPSIPHYEPAPATSEKCRFKC